jgi:hypothetical protein
MHDAIPPRSTNSSHLAAAVLAHGLVRDAFPSPSSDSPPRKPLRSMSRARSTFPNFEEEKTYYGYRETHREARAGPRPTIAQAQFPEDNTPRRGSLPPSRHRINRGSSDVLLNMYQNEPDARATMRRRESSFGRLQDAGEMSVRTRPIADTPPSLPHSRHGMNARSSDVRLNIYQNEPDARATMRRCESSFARLQDHGKSDRTILETSSSLPSSGRGMNALSTGVLLNMYRNKPDTGAIMRRSESSSKRLPDTGESTRPITDTPPSLPPSRRRMNSGSRPSAVLENVYQNEPDTRAKARLRESALARLQDTGEMSVRTRPIIDTAPSLPPSRRGMNVGSRSSDVVVGVYQNEHDVSEGRRRESARARLQKDSKWSSSTQAMKDTAPSQPSSRRRTRSACDSTEALNDTVPRSPGCRTSATRFVSARSDASWPGSLDLEAYGYEDMEQEMGTSPRSTKILQGSPPGKRVGTTGPASAGRIEFKRQAGNAFYGYEDMK